jgi:molybdate transport system substrate-binding protein
MRQFSFGVLLGGLLASAALLPAAELQVYAAASLRDALRELGGRYEKSGGEKLVFNFEASNLLARHILEGAPADLFASADAAQMDRVQEQGLLLGKSRRNLLSNQLAVVALKESPLSLSAAADLAGPAVGRISIADPKAVPNGVYARQYFEKLGLWARLEPKVIPVQNVRGSLAAVESGNVDVAVLYRSDAQISDKVKLLFEVPAAKGPAIVYPFAALKGGSNPRGAQRFLKYLSGKDSLAVFRRYGFLTPAFKP